MTPENGTAARVELLERQQRETFNRLRVLDRLEERVKNIGEDVVEVRDQLATARQERVDDDHERRRLTAGEKVAVIGAIAVVLASLIAALASLAAAGVL